MSATFTYARRTIKPKLFVGERPILTTLNDSLFPSHQVLNGTDLSAQTIAEPPPLILKVPYSPDVDTSIMSFGIATHIPRLNQSIPQLSHWLSNTGCPLHVVAPHHDSTNYTTSLIQSHPININLNVTTSELPFAKAYFSLVKRLYESRTPDTQWLVLIDDDTFIPSLPYLVSHLTATYDATKPQIIAAMSDDLDQIKSFGLIPFGGGGIFISVPLAAILTSPEVYDKCIANPNYQGDQVLNECLNKHTDVRPIFDHGLNQMDLFGEPDGYFESGRRMLTVHHWKSWFYVDVPMGGKVAQATGDEGVFMRWKFQDVVLSNGFSIAEYPGGLAEIDFEKVEKTWPGQDSRFLHHIGPLRAKLPGEMKKSFRLVEAVVMAEGVRQVYLHEAQDGVNGVLELLWLS